MMFADFLFILNWWTTWLFIGILSLPVTLLWLRPLWDNGYGFAKVLGVAVVGYAVWLGASLHLFRFGGTSLWVTLGIWAAINGWLWWKYKGELLPLAKKQWSVWLKVEMLFLISTTMWAFVRGYQPEINGLEKFMDYGFVQSILRTEYFPPQDMWFAGGFINYYYFGHYLSAVIIAFSEIPPQIAYNLQMAALFGIAVSGGMSLGASLVDILRTITENRISYRWVSMGGLLAAFLLAVRGNLHWGAWQLNRILNGCFYLKSIADPDEVLPTCSTSYSWLPDAMKDYWYPDATRYIEYTIHEFPMYSYVVADLHAHLINVNLVLVFLAGILVLWRKQSVAWWEIGIFGWLLGVFYMSNAWDLPIYLMVLGATVMMIGLFKYPLPGKTLSSLVSAGILAVGLMILVIFVRHVPDPQQATSESGVAVALTAENSGMVNALRQRFVWLLVAGIGGFIIYTLRQMWMLEETQKSALGLLKEYIPKVGAAAVLAIVVSLPFQLKFEQIAQGIAPVARQSERAKMWALWGWEVFLVVSLGLICLRLIQLHKRHKEHAPLSPLSRLLSTDLLVLTLFAIGFFLIVLPEFIYVKDIYIQEYHRANTMFKLVYQSWVIFALASSYTIVRLINLPRNVWGWSPVKWMWSAVVVVLIWAMANYPIAAINSYYGELRTYRGLDGEKWLADKQDSGYEVQLSPKDPSVSDEYAALLWLRQLEGQPVILEAVGDSYTEFNRFSAYSGLPSIEGWLVHEWLWRGSYDRPGRRAAEVEHIYTANNPEETKPAYQAPDLPAPRKLLDQYKVEYMIVGAKEREKYGENLKESTISLMGEVVFESGDTRIYKVRK